MSLRPLRGLFQGAFDERQAALGLFAHQVFAVAAVFLCAVQFIGNRQRHQHGNFLRIHRRRSSGNRVHFFVDVLREFVNVRFVQIAANRVRLPENLDFYWCAHDSLLDSPGAKIPQP